MAGADGIAFARTADIFGERAAYLGEAGSEKAPLLGGLSLLWLF